MQLLIQFLLLFCFSLRFLLCHECFTPTPPLHHTITDDDSQDVKSKRSIQNLRIHVHYDVSFNDLGDKVDEVKNKLVRPAMDYWSKTLKPKHPASSTLLIDKTCLNNKKQIKIHNGKKIQLCTEGCISNQLCFHTPVPEQYLKKCYKNNGSGGVTEIGADGSGASNSDMLIIVTYKSHSCSATTLAYATACDISSKDDRPVLALVNLCTNRVRLGFETETSLGVLKHEIAHSLGMSIGLYPYFRNILTGEPLTERDPNGVPKVIDLYDGKRLYKPSTDTMITKDITFNYRTGSFSKKTYILVTPTLKKAVQDYFNCPTAEGAFLEDYGTLTNALSHFEKRIFTSELMTAVVSVETHTSIFTLSLMKDTGWYDVDFSKAQPFSTGKEKGCDLLNMSCFDYINKKLAAGQSLDPFCNRMFSGVFCAPDYSKLYFCPLIKSSSSTPSLMYRYFADPNVVSFDPFSEYCPVTQAYKHKTYTGICNDENNDEISLKQNYLNQNFGSSSTCVNFANNNNWYYEMCDKRYSNVTNGAGCFKYECVSGSGLMIVVAGLKHQCRSEGQEIDVTASNKYQIVHGKLKCPKCTAICKSDICSSVSKKIEPPCNNVNRICDKKLDIPCRSCFIQPSISLLFGMFFMNVVLYFSYF